MATFHQTLPPYNSVDFIEQNWGCMLCRWQNWHISIRIYTINHEKKSKMIGLTSCKINNENYHGHEIWTSTQKLIAQQWYLFFHRITLRQDRVIPNTNEPFFSSLQWVPRNSISQGNKKLYNQPVLVHSGSPTITTNIVELPCSIIIFHFQRVCSYVIPVLCLDLHWLNRNGYLTKQKQGCSSPWPQPCAQNT